MMYLRRIALTALALACSTAEPVVQPLPGEWTPEELTLLASLRLDPTLPESASNRWADDPAAAALGRQLFFDASLSPSGTQSCASCHMPELGFTDGRRVAVGVGKTTRNTPAIPGSQYGAWQYWDGRADSLWAQAAGPIESADEMASDRTFVARRVIDAYREPYAALFGDPPDLDDSERFPERARPDPDPRSDLARAWESMSSEDQRAVMRVFSNVLKAIAAYERTLLPTDSPFDRYVDAVAAGDAQGGEHLDDAQVRGLSLFVRQANCVACHHGPMFTDRAFHNLGLPFSGPFDPGRSQGARAVLDHELNCRSPWSDAESCEELEYLDPSFPDFEQAFKTPSLRGVARTAPYMHHGELATLHDVLAFYDELPGSESVNHRELTLQPLSLTREQREDIIRFLHALSGEPLPADRLRPSPPDGDPAPPTR